jgi:hypothetical protein
MNSNINNHQLLCDVLINSPKPKDIPREIINQIRKEKIKLSFDFDGTLDRISVQEYAKELIDKGFEVWIVTARLSDAEAPSIKWNQDLHKIREELGIQKDRVKFMAYQNKSEFFKDKDFLWHLDDDFIELQFINREKTCKTKGISCFGNNVWKGKCNRIINKFIKKLN